MNETFSGKLNQEKFHLFDFLTACLVVCVWGANFTVLKMGLLELDPFLLGAFCYMLTAFPAIFFIRRPEIEFRYLVAYGLTVGLGQFGCLFYALKIGMPASIASILMQTQAFMTCILAVLVLKEKLSPLQVAGLVIATPGLFLIASGTTPLGAPEIPRTAVALTLGAAFSWAMSNIVVRLSASRARFKKVRLNMLGYILWSSLIPPVQFLLLALYTTSSVEVFDSINNIGFLSLFVIFYNAFLATLFGFGFWGKLLTRYPAARVAPFSLLIPVTALVMARLVLHERLSAYQWLGCAAIFCGLLVNTLSQYRE